MPIRENGGLLKKQVIISHSLDIRLKKYVAQNKNRTNMSEVVRTALETFLRERGF